MSDARWSGQTAQASVESCLDAIARLDPVLGAFITSMPEHALDDARRADAAARRGDWLGLLHGMPVAVKDCIDVAGVRCTHGSAFFADRIASEDADVVQRLRAAGAIIVGKTNLHEFAYGGTTQNADFGACRNPWDVRRLPGGSSGGSAVAVAAGMCIGALGTDTGASIRLPASLNGISGLRPTFGSVSPAGILPVSPPHDIAGPMARSTADLARIYAAISGGPGQRAGGQDLLHRLGAGVAGLRIVMPTDFCFDGVDQAVATAVLAAARVLESQGARIVEHPLPGAARAQSQLMPVLFVDAAQFHRQRLLDEPEKFSVGVRRRLEPGLQLGATDYAAALRWLEGWRREASAFFQDVGDAVLTPTVPVTAPEIQPDEALTEVTTALTRFSWAWPAARMPALSVPCGFSAGLPIGMQLAAGRWQDPLLLQIGQSFQAATDWHRHVPPMAAPS